MPRPADHPDEPSSVPPPELNPLLNPLLAKNMGRWAEVYFTSPPEKREQAVLELLRQLEAENPSPANSAEGSLAQKQTPGTGLVPGWQNTEAEPTTIRCRSCGRENPVSQRFCGMCGTRLAEEAAAPHARVESRQDEDELPADSAEYTQSQEPHSAAMERSVVTPAFGSSELSLFQTGSGLTSGRYDKGDEFGDSAPTRSYRIYVGVALAIVIAVLGYMGWRSAQATSQSAYVEPKAPPAVSSQPAMEEPAAQATPNAGSTDNNLAKENEPTTSSNSAPGTGAHRANDPRTTPTPTKVAQPATNAPAIDTNIPRAHAVPGNGSEELAVAQRYLKGANGQSRDSSEAAKWLWMAVAKHNGQATVLLSDLYLKGDGVPKNCDQARLLLDAAARNGMSDAGERLRHLDAFGCQ